MNISMKRNVSRTLGAVILGTLISAGMPAPRLLAADAPAAVKVKVNVNTATEAQLQQLPNVGPEIAKKIIANRPYKTVADLSKAGIGEKRQAALAPHVLFEKIDINTASAKELEELPYVGPVFAKKIIEHRPYQNSQDLAKAGLTEVKIAEIAPLVNFPTPAPVAAAPAPAPAPVPAPATPAAPAPTPAVPAPAPMPAQAGKIDLNSATAQELKTLPGVTDAQAQRIIANRPYKSASELSKAGFNAQRIAEVTPRLTFGQTAAPTPAVATPGTGNKIDLNTASAAELKMLPGVTDAEAQRIIANRPYKSAEELNKVGFNQQRIAEVTPRLTFEMPAAPAAAVIPGKKLDINTASPAELKTLPGVNDAEAQKIIANRPYKSANDLSKAGFNAQRISEVSSRLTFEMPSTPAATPAPARGGTVDLNTASVKELETLPGVTEAEAQRIIANRPYKSAQDLSKVGFNQKRISEVSSRVTFDMPKSGK